MGFTRYWVRTKKPFPKAFLSDARKILKDCEKKGIFISGDRYDGPVISKDGICFNGCNNSYSLMCETFYLSNEPGFSSCKTEQKPYDYAVREVLRKAEEYGLVKDVDADEVYEEVYSDEMYLIVVTVVGQMTDSCKEVLDYEMNEKDKFLANVVLGIINAYDKASDPHVIREPTLEDLKYSIVHSPKGYFFFKYCDDNPDDLDFGIAAEEIGMFLFYLFTVVGDNGPVDIFDIQESPAVIDAVKEMFGVDDAILYIGPAGEYEGEMVFPAIGVIITDDNKAEELKSKGFKEIVNRKDGIKGLELRF